MRERYTASQDNCGSRNPTSEDYSQYAGSRIPFARIAAYDQRQLDFSAVFAQRTAISVDSPTNHTPTQMLGIQNFRHRLGSRNIPPNGLHRSRSGTRTLKSLRNAPSSEISQRSRPCPLDARGLQRHRINASVLVQVSTYLLKEKSRSNGSALSTCADIASHARRLHYSSSERSASPISSGYSLAQVHSMREVLRRSLRAHHEGILAFARYGDSALAAKLDSAEQHRVLGIK